MQKKEKIITQLKNKNEYQIFDNYSAGIMLNGDEVKSIKKGQVSLNKNVYISIENNEIFINNLLISPFFYSFSKKKETRKKIKLLLKKEEILRIINKTKTKKCEVIPFIIVVKNNWIKLEIVIAKHLKKYEINKKKVERKKNKKVKEEDF